MIIRRCLVCLQLEHLAMLARDFDLAFDHEHDGEDARGRALPRHDGLVEGEGRGRSLWHQERSGAQPWARAVAGRFCRCGADSRPGVRTRKEIRRA